MGRHGPDGVLTGRYFRTAASRVRADEGFPVTCHGVEPGGNGSNADPRALRGRGWLASSGRRPAEAAAGRPAGAVPGWSSAGAWWRRMAGASGPGGRGPPTSSTRCCIRSRPTPGSVHAPKVGLAACSRPVPRPVSVSRHHDASRRPIFEDNAFHRRGNLDLTRARLGHRQHRRGRHCRGRCVR